MVFIYGGEGDSGRKTSDGYDLPTRRVETWVVTGPGALQRTVDRTDEGGTVTSEVCSGLSAAAPGTAPVPTGCSPS
jgi:hypothetical protein